MAYDRCVLAAQFRVEVTKNQPLSGGYFVLTCRSEGDNPVAQCRSGQFVMLRGEWGRDLLNGRAFSVLEVLGPREFSVLLKVFGRGTSLMQQMGPGDEMTCTGPLGNGFPQPRRGGPLQLLVAGGVGLPPLHLHALRAAAAGLTDRVEVFYGGRNANDLVLLEPLERAGVSTTLATEDGSRGVKGFVTAPLVQRVEAARAAGEEFEVLSCGPTPMLKAVRALALQYDFGAHLCLEEQMACGFGVCLGCAVPVYGDKPYEYCCTDGPVFPARKVRWPA